MLSSTKATGMSLAEVHQFLESGVLVSDLKTKCFIAKNKRKVLGGVFKDCITRGGRWKRAFETEREAYTWNCAWKRKNLMFTYPCQIHGFHISYYDSATEKRKVRHNGK